MKNLEQFFDIIVVGAGHAGCEASLACARLGLNTVMFTVSVDSIALMPCNPNVGGSSKGHLVRELDALGGEMGKNIDKTFIQSKMLNQSKGPAVHVAYSREPQSMRHMRPRFHNPCGIYSQSSATHAAYTAGVPQSMRYIRRGLRNLYYATIYPTEIYKVPFDTFRLSVELPIQKHTDTS